MLLEAQDDDQYKSTKTKHVLEAYFNGAMLSDAAVVLWYGWTSLARVQDGGIQTKFVPLHLAQVALFTAALATQRWSRATRRCILPEL